MALEQGDARDTLHQRRQAKYLALAAAQRAAGGGAAAAEAIMAESMPLAALELGDIGPPSPARDGNVSPGGRVRVSQSAVQDRLSRGGGMPFFV